MAKLLLVDDDTEASQSLLRALRAHGIEHPADIVATPDRALELVQAAPPHVAVLDLSLVPGRGTESGLLLLQQILRAAPATRVIVLTGHGGGETGIRALTLGAANFLEKPADVPHLAALIRDGVAQSELKRDHGRLLRESRGEVAAMLCAGSAAMQPVAAAIEYAAEVNQSVLLTGETGTGKGVCARLIHQRSRRRQAPFVRYQPSCGTGDLVSSDLFGHVKGAFTGATADRRGLIEEADSGTLFLDEVDELPSEVQVALLGVLQERRFRPVGSTREVASDFRLIAASNDDLPGAIDRGKLRRDLYHRLAHLTISLPPLRERREDIPALARSIVERVSEREQIPLREITSAAMADLAGAPWPGNIRELEAVVEGGIWRAQHAGRSMVLPGDLSIGQPGRPVAAQGGFHEQVEGFKHRLIAEALHRHGGNQVQAAKELGLDRSTMRRFLARQDPEG